MINEKKIQYDYNKLKKIARVYMEKRDFEKSLKAIELLGNMMYNINLFYTDDEIESIISTISAVVNEKNYFLANEKRVLFYDGFGLDTRGLALIYIKALVNLGYEVVYVTFEKSSDIPNIKACLEQGNNNKIELLPRNSIIESSNLLNKIIKKNLISKAFLYTLPADMVGINVFTAYAGIIKRYMINLTDHAYWIGKSAFDYILEFRDYGASVSVTRRNILKEKVLKQPYYPIINREVEFSGFPFDDKDKKVIFSGGALYKTFGDNNQYYQIIDYILNQYRDVLFLYAGYGDGSELKRLMHKYQNRVFWIDEREDLYEVMRHSYLYLSTYPMIGGLMTQYAVAAGTLPMTLIFDDCATGVLLEPQKIGCEFKNKEEYIKNLDLVLSSREEVEKRKEQLKEQLISEELFEDNLKLVIENSSSNFLIKYENIETARFQKTYLERLSIEQYYRLFLKKRNLFMVKYFPIKCFGAAISIIKEKICK